MATTTVKPIDSQGIPLQAIEQAYADRVRALPEHPLFEKSTPGDALTADFGGGSGAQIMDISANIVLMSMVTFPDAAKPEMQPDGTAKQFDMGEHITKLDWRKRARSLYVADMDAIATTHLQGHRRHIPQDDIMYRITWDAAQTGWGEEVTVGSKARVASMANGTVIIWVASITHGILRLTLGPGWHYSATKPGPDMPHEKRLVVRATNARAFMPVWDAQDSFPEQFRAAKAYQRGCPGTPRVMHTDKHSGALACVYQSSSGARKVAIVIAASAHTGAILTDIDNAANTPEPQGVAHAVCMEKTLIAAFDGGQVVSYPLRDLTPAGPPPEGTRNLQPVKMGEGAQAFTIMDIDSILRRRARTDQATYAKSYLVHADEQGIHAYITNVTHLDVVYWPMEKKPGFLYGAIVAVINDTAIRAELAVNASGSARIITRPTITTMPTCTHIVTGRNIIAGVNNINPVVLFKVPGLHSLHTVDTTLSSDHPGRIATALNPIPITMWTHRDGTTMAVMWNTGNSTVAMRIIHGAFRTTPEGMAIAKRRCQAVQERIKSDYGELQPVKLTDPKLRNAIREKLKAKLAATSAHTHALDEHPPTAAAGAGSGAGAGK